jgi:hypothetical protein
MILFGMSFAIASLGCTIGPFLGIIVASFATGSAAQGTGLFVAYAAGMALVVGAVAVAVALAQQTVISAMRRAAPSLSRAAGVLMAVAGAYVAWYGWYEIRIYADPATTDPVIDTAADVQTGLSRFIDGIGPAGIAMGFAGIIAMLAAVAWRRRIGR